jgi:hypothetical protein
MLQIMQDSSEGWKKAENSLWKLKAHTAGFDYQIDTAMVAGAIAWITPNMCKSWILYGATIFLDAMIWKMTNSLQWLHTGPASGFGPWARNGSISSVSVSALLKSWKSMHLSWSH